MRLLHTSELRTQEFAEGSIPEYAILSHTWDEQELSFQDVSSGNFADLAGFDKMRRTCETVRDKYRYIWIDTLCIDKTNSAELSLAINSMYSWYEGADMCYVYLKDFESHGETLADDLCKGYDSLKNCRWFSRGWTLQELLAPQRVTFWDKKWTKFGDKSSLHNILSAITGIPDAVLRGFKEPRHCIVGQIMSWASSRKTTRSEDIAYCLLGLFDVNQVPIYGEGLFNAFIRLQEKILKKRSDHSIFIWSPQHDTRNRGLLATSPKPFCKHRKCYSWLDNSITSSAGPFDPYECMRLVEPSMRKVSALRDGRVVTHYPLYDSVSRKDIYAPSLGPQGLQISLLADERIKHIQDGPAIRDLLIAPFMICFDLMYLGPTSQSNILLPVFLDLIFGTESTELSRRGFLSRRPMRPVPNYDITYRIHSDSEQFVRQTLSISQQEPTSRATKEVRFILKSLPTTATLGGIALDSTAPHAPGVLGLDDLMAGVICFGGRVGFTHNLSSNRTSPLCVNVPFLISFGIHGLKPKAWCCITTGRLVEISESDVTQPDLNRHSLLEVFSSGSQSVGYRPLPQGRCNHWIHLSVVPAKYQDGSSDVPVFEIHLAICEENSYKDLKGGL
jgi:Heterokaryon incompatibility protein (HET)